MLSLYIIKLPDIIQDDYTKRIFECIGTSQEGQTLPWLNDNVIFLFTSYTLMSQSLLKDARLASRIRIVDSQVTEGLVNRIQVMNENVMEKKARVAEMLRQIYSEYSVVIHPMFLEEHWFLIVYSDNTFRIYDSLRSGLSEDAMASLDLAVFGPRSMKKREFASPSIFQTSYWECGYFVCSIIQDILGRYNPDTNRLVPPSISEVRKYAEQTHCHTIAKQMLQVYNKCRSLFSLQ